MAHTKKTTPTTPTALAAHIDHISVTTFLETKNLSYMRYSVVARALPHIVSGVKPGAQRLLWSMYQDGALPGTKARKSAKLTSAATGAYHPHGQSSMYGTLTTLARTYNRVSLIEGIGAFGIAPGDEPAADRYTEARLSPAGVLLVEEASQGAVEMKPTYDGENLEPVVLPAQFPALLCMGAEGMGEGWATRFPQHNPREAIHAALLLLDNPDATVDDLLDVMPGPDWGTGGSVVGSADGIRDYYTTGRGKMTVRGTVVKHKRGFTITEVPPSVSVSTLLDGSGKGKNPQPGLRDLARSGTIAGIADVSDLTDLEHGLRIEVATKRGYNVDDVITDVFQATDLEITYAASLVALSNDFIPRWWTMHEALTEFLNGRDRAIQSRSQAVLEKLETQLARAEAILAIVLNKDEAVRILRGADNKADAVAQLAGHFELSHTQATYVTEMPLYRLTKADTLDAQRRCNELNKKKTALEKLVRSKAARKKTIRTELKNTLKHFPEADYARCTRLEHDEKPAGGVTELTDAEKLPLWRLDGDTFGIGPTGDPIPQGHSVWTAFTDGKVRRFDGKGLPKNITLKPIAPQVERVYATGTYDPTTHHLFVVTAGTNKSHTAKVLRLDTSTMNPQGIAGNGVAGLKLTDSDRVVGAFVATDEDELLTVSATGWKVTPIADIPVKGTGTQGVGVHSLTNKDTDGVFTVACAPAGRFVVNEKPAKPRSRAQAPKREVVANWEVAAPEG